MMMMMDGEEEITWNLKGPKRMKKRRELNALIRNNVKYKSLPQGGHHPHMKSDEFSMINCSSTTTGAAGGPNAGRLLNGLNYSSTDDEQRDFFFSANKSVLKEKSRSYYCKIFQMILIGCFVTMFVLVAIVLLFSYAKFHELLNELKREVDLQNVQNRKSLDDIAKQLDQYDVMLKQLETKVNGDLKTMDSKGRGPRETTSESQQQQSETTSGNEAARKRVARSIQSIDATNKVNTHLIKWLFNQSSSINPSFPPPPTPSRKSAQNKERGGLKAARPNNILSSLFSKAAATAVDRNELYQKVVDEFLKSNYDLALILDMTTLSSLESSSPSQQQQQQQAMTSDLFAGDLEAYFLSLEQSIKYEILDEIETNYKNHLMNVMYKCGCGEAAGRNVSSNDGA